MADKSRDPEALQRQIERTRLELIQTIDELAGRVNPRTAAQRGAERLKDEAGQVVRTFGAMIKPPERKDLESDDVPASGGVDPKLVAAAVGVGAVAAVTALVVWRRRRRR
jgi:hypothetical protein